MSKELSVLAMVLAEETKNYDQTLKRFNLLDEEVTKRFMLDRPMPADVRIARERLNVLKHAISTFYCDKPELSEALLILFADVWKFVGNLTTEENDILQSVINRMKSEEPLEKQDHVKVMASVVGISFLNPNRITEPQTAPKTSDVG